MGMSEAKGRKMGGSGEGGGRGGDGANRMGAMIRATLAMQIQMSMLFSPSVRLSDDGKSCRVWL